MVRRLDSLRYFWSGFMLFSFHSSSITLDVRIRLVDASLCANR
jgi:hypothetical protein